MKNILFPFLIRGFSKTCVPQDVSILFKGRIKWALMLFCVLFLVPVVQARQFELEHPRVVVREPKVKKGEIPLTDFVPYMEVDLRVGADMPVGKAYVKAYFYDFRGWRIEDIQPISPEKARYDKVGTPTLLPFYLYHKTPIKVRFKLPMYRLSQGWRAVIVFGDDKDATAITAAEELQYANAMPGPAYVFPEQKLTQQKSVSRFKPMDKLTETKCPTGLPDYPHFTLFTRLPDGVANGKEAEGVLCLALLANQITDVRLSLMNREAQGDIADMIRYADNKKLVVLCWAIKQLWDPGKNWDELSPETAKNIQARMKKVSEGWAKGVRHVAGEYGFEPKNFLIWGYSDSAQFAGRLALQQPQFFSAVHMHNPGSFDKPTVAASKIIWSLTMGEVDSGYGRAVKFQKASYDLGYTFFFKAVPGMGHDNDRGSRQLATLVFEYARSLPTDPKERATRISADAWAAKSCGDWLNQTVETGADIEGIPMRLRVPFPNTVLAKSWKRERLSKAEDPAAKEAAKTEMAASAEERKGPARVVAKPQKKPDTGGGGGNGESTLFGTRIKEEKKPEPSGGGESTLFGTRIKNEENK